MRRNPDYEAQVQQLLDTAPPSWRRAFRSYALPARPSVHEVVDVMLEQTAGGQDAGPRGRQGRVPPVPVRAAAFKGLVLSHREDYAGWDGIGIARAVQLAIEPTIWPRSIKRMRGFFGRNRRYRSYRGFGDDRNPSKSYMAWLNWGGDPGARWVGVL
jgi:hypothetical protein